MSERDEITLCTFDNHGHGHGECACACHQPATGQREATPHHTVTFTVSEDGFVGMKVACPHELLGTDRPCSAWTENGKDEPCICECDACKDGDHDDCEEEWVEGIGQKWCQCRPMDMCWYQHMALGVGPEAFNFGRNGISFIVPVKFSGGSPDDAIDVEVVA